MSHPGFGIGALADLPAALRQLADRVQRLSIWRGTTAEFCLEQDDIALALWRIARALERGDTFTDEKSERWQEGNAGTAHQNFLDEWEGLEIEAFETPELEFEPCDLDTIAGTSTDANDGRPGRGAGTARPGPA